MRYLTRLALPAGATYRQITEPERRPSEAAETATGIAQTVLPVAVGSQDVVVEPDLTDRSVRGFVIVARAGPSVPLGRLGPDLLVTRVPRVPIAPFESRAPGHLPSSRPPILARLMNDGHPHRGPERLRVAGLFAGIGGIELGLHRAGHETVLLCEKDAAAARVLAHHFPRIELHDDVTTLESLSDVDIVAAGFPCQDLSQAGRTAGIRGRQSSLVDHVFRLLDHAANEPKWLLLENVPFMLQLDRGRAMTHLTQMLSSRGYTWAYRVVDTRAFGLPQRRQRVLLLASKTHDPRPVLFAEKAEPAEPPVLPDSVYGFYWTEGLRGLGLAVDAVPTLKGGSTIGIPSPPAIWMRAHQGEPLVTPDLRDAERLQGFEADWTASAVDEPRARNGPRWKLVGNAVSVPVASWLGRQLAVPPSGWAAEETERDPSRPWPNAAWGSRDTTWTVDVGMWPVAERFQRLADFLEYEPRPLSERAAAGFLERARRSTLRFPLGFIEAVAEHCDRMSHVLRAA